MEILSAIQTIVAFSTLTMILHVT